MDTQRLKKWLDKVELIIIPWLEKQLEEEVNHYQSLNNHKIHWWQITAALWINSFKKKSIAKQAQIKNRIEEYKNYLSAERRKLERSRK